MSSDSESSAYFQSASSQLRQAAEADWEVCATFFSTETDHTEVVRFPIPNVQNFPASMKLSSRSLIIPAFLLSLCAPVLAETIEVRADAWPPYNIQPGTPCSVTLSSFWRQFSRMVESITKSVLGRAPSKT